jgi:Protein of unknown function (DUF3987)
MTRQGNTLNSVLREAWDGRPLQILTKTSPARATGAYISVVAHITVEELRAELSDIDAANGFANRFIWIAVRRSKLLPEPRPLDETVLRHLAHKVKSAVMVGRTVGEMVKDARARSLWQEVYETLSREREGLAGSILARAEAQVLRLSMLYALLEQSTIIMESHLKSALALWEYCERSALYIFKDATGNAIADTIYRTLKQNGRLTRTQIFDLFGRNESRGRIDSALGLLLEWGKARVYYEASGGRPTEIWVAVQ